MVCLCNFLHEKETRHILFFNQIFTSLKIEDLPHSGQFVSVTLIMIIGVEILMYGDIFTTDNSHNRTLKFNSKILSEVGVKEIETDRLKFRHFTV